ncbi:nucleotide-diphospho-sugar transferase [Pelagophyceae sp. CCMP2097]|nr:nucleotide-diphospho-sugar transferase [Pelagophyceae sp. CCMP2097]
MAAGAPPRAPLRRRRLVALLLLLQHRPAAASTAAAAPPPPAGFCERGSTAAFASGRVCCRKSCEAGCRRACRKGATECCPAAIWAAETCGGARDVDCAARDGDAVKSVAAAARSSTDVDVVIAGDRVQALGLLACARSLFSAAKDPDRLKLHLIVDAAALDDVERALKCLFAVDGAVDGERRRFTVYPFDLAIASGIKHPAIRASAGLKGNLAAGPNFARFYLGAILPKEVRKVVYLDADTVVLRDVAQLYDTALTDETPSSQAVAAVARPTKTVCGSFVNCRSADVARLLASQGISDPEKQLDAFNAGVMVLHLGRWEALGLTGKVEFWINWNADLPLYKLGSNPPLVLAVRGAFQPVDEIWNCQRGHACWPTAAVKHWSGAKKPWWLDADRDRTEWLVHLQGPDANASRRCLDVGGLPRLGERPAVAPDRDRNATQRSTRPAKGDRAAADARQMDAAKRLAALAADAPGLKAPELRINSAARDAAVSRALDASLAAAGKTAGPRGLLRALRRLLDGVGCGYVGVAILRGVLHVETAHYGRGRRCGLVPPDAVVDALGFLDEAVLRNAAARPVADAFFVLCANQRGISESERGIFETEKGLPIFTFVKRAGHAAPGILVPGPRQMTQAGGPGNDHDRKQDGDRRASVVDICRKWQRRFEDLTAPSARLGEEPSASVDAEWHAREGRVFWRGRIEPGYDCGDDATWARLEAAALTL